MTEQHAKTVGKVIACLICGWPMRSPNKYAHDDQLARKLYEVSLEMVGLSVH